MLGLTIDSQTRMIARLRLLLGRATWYGFTIHSNVLLTEILYYVLILHCVVQASFFIYVISELIALKMHTFHVFI